MVAGIGVVAVAAAGVAGIRSLSEPSVLKVSAIISLLSVMIWIARSQLVPSVSASESVLVVRNRFDTYEIPWQMLKAIDWEPRTGVLSLDLADGRRVRVNAFSRWPSFGRHRKVIAILEQGRSQAERRPPADIRETEASGIPGMVEFFLLIPFAVTLVALVVAGIMVLL
ncbi:hypothetical protein ACIPSE_44680 [Streptomyces sp. NPDC090106]|uniref:hypothetical protein n=1 Tax=Streptomyces sp. NPDC090106 TaxID=3365946 RepID=UPI0037F90210